MLGILVMDLDTTRNRGVGAPELHAVWVLY